MSGHNQESRPLSVGDDVRMTLRHGGDQRGVVVRLGHSRVLVRLAGSGNTIERRREEVLRLGL